MDSTHYSVHYNDNGVLHVAYLRSTGDTVDFLKNLAKRGLEGEAKQNYERVGGVVALLEEGREDYSWRWWLVTPEKKWQGIEYPA